MTGIAMLIIEAEDATAAEAAAAAGETMAEVPSCEWKKVSRPVRNREARPARAS